MKRTFNNEESEKRRRMIDPMEFYKDHKSSGLGAAGLRNMLDSIRDHSLPDPGFLANYALLGHVKKRFPVESGITRKRLAEGLVEARVSKPMIYNGKNISLALVFCLPGCDNNLRILSGANSPFNGQFHTHINGGLVVIFTTLVAHMDPPRDSTTTTLSFTQKTRYRLGLNSPLPIECTQTYPCHHERNFRILGYLSSTLGLPSDLVDLIIPDVFAARAKDYRGHLAGGIYRLGQ